MSEKEKDILKRIASVIPELSREKQSYVLGIAEGMAIAKEENSDGRKKRELAGAV